ncbi:hypothetical protein MY4038_009819 [Beauveria bassiana]
MKSSTTLPIFASLAMAFSVPQKGGNTYPLSVDDIVQRTQANVDAARENQWTDAKEVNFDCKVVDNHVECDTSEPTSPVQNNFKALCDEVGCGGCTPPIGSRFIGNWAVYNFKCKIDSSLAKAVPTPRKPRDDYPYSVDDILQKAQASVDAAREQGWTDDKELNFNCKVVDNFVHCDTSKPTSPVQNNFRVLCDEVGCGGCTPLGGSRWIGNYADWSFDCKTDANLIKFRQVTEPIFHQSVNDVLLVIQNLVDDARAQGRTDDKELNFDCKRVGNLVKCDTSKPTSPVQNNFKALCDEVGCGGCSAINEGDFFLDYATFHFSCKIGKVEGEVKNTKGRSLLARRGPSLTFLYETNQPSSGNWIGVWPDSDAQAPQSGSAAWQYAKRNTGFIRIPPASSMKAGKYKAYLLSSDRTILASLPSFDYSPTSDSVAFSVKTHYNTNCAGSADNNVDIQPGNGVCVNTNCAVGSLEIPSVGSCPDGEIRISYWQNADCKGDWYGYGYGSRDTCRGLWSNGWGFKSLWLSCAEPDSDCVKQGTCTAAPEPSTEVCRATADAGTTDAFHLKTRYNTGCTGDVHNEVTVPHGNGQCIDTNCAVGSLDIDNVGNCPDRELRISYWEQPGCSGKWFGYGYGSRNTCRTLWSGGSRFKSLWVSCAKQSDDCVSLGTCSIDEVPSRPVC